MNLITTVVFPLDFKLIVANYIYTSLKGITLKFIIMAKTLADLPSKAAAQLPAIAFIKKLKHSQNRAGYIHLGAKTST